ncbi:hypothetical protein KIH74_04665 [Kineosporia sp. J2-2]|uniref:Phage tail protein n=1 Tax=Kineosporia corallincola TaxID=2835133 RepID=A0ABS5TAV1_9ACTN|nr:hypothetical protein [Kineosporia corallincola]MBT0768202.1 hypothetical protein [Kineosporia corallincola]
MNAPSPGWLVRQLPVAMLEDDFTARFATIFEDVAGTLVHSADNIGRAADLSVTPDPLVHWLGSWIGAPADPEENLHDVRERDWVRAQARALSARGTSTGLRELLEQLSGGHPVEIIDGGGVYREDTCPDDDTGWVMIRMPLPGNTLPEYVLELVRTEVPIGVRVELVVMPTPGIASAAFTELIPSPREPEPETPAQERWTTVAGGPFFWDGGPGDVHPPLGEAVTPPVVAEPAPALAGPARRLPGTGGRAVRPGRLCPACAEPAEAVAVECARCGSALRVTTSPVVETEPLEDDEPFVWPDGPWDEEPRPWWMAGLVLGGLLLALVVGLLLLR